MLNWLTNLFRSDPVAPADSSPIYRRSTRPTPKPRPIADTLFERPAEQPPAPVVSVVPPGTQADAYKWLDYEKPTVQVVTDAPPSSPVKIDANPSGGGWGIALSGTCTMITGSILHLCSTGRWGSGDGSYLYRGSADKIVLDKQDQDPHSAL